MLYNALGDRDRLQSALEITSQVQQMATDNLVSHQYRLAAACEAAGAHLKLAQHFSGRKRKSSERQAHLAQALESSQSALTIYQQFGFVQIVECTSEEILYRHSLALGANDRLVEAADFLERAYKEMMRKHDLIPVDSPFRKTFLDNMALHREIQVAYAAQTTRSVPPLSDSHSDSEDTS